MSLFNRLYLQSLKIRGFYEAEPQFEFERSQQAPKSVFAKAANLLKNSGTLILSAGHMILSVAALIEAMSLIAVYILPLLAIGTLCLFSENLASFAHKCFERAFTVAQNNLRITTLLLAAASIAMAIQFAAGFGFAPLFSLKDVAYMSKADSIISVILGITATVATLCSDTVNTLFRKIGLLKEKDSSFTTRLYDKAKSFLQKIGLFTNTDAKQNRTKIWQLTGTLLTVAATAYLQPALLFGISATSLVAGVGAAMGEAAQNIFGSNKNTSTSSAKPASRQRARNVENNYYYFGDPLYSRPVYYHPYYYHNNHCHNYDAPRSAAQTTARTINPPPSCSSSVPQFAISLASSCRP